MSAPRHLPKRARSRISPRTARHIERQRQRRRVKDLLHRIMDRHYPDRSQECPF